MIRNISNGKSIVGAVLQQTLNTENSIISSDAAKTLGINKNEQTKVQIIAVRAANSTVRKKRKYKSRFHKKLLQTKPILQSLLFKLEYLVSKIMLTKQKTKW